MIRHNLRNFIKKNLTLTPHPKITAIRDTSQLTPDYTLVRCAACGKPIVEIHRTMQGVVRIMCHWCKKYTLVAQE